MRITIPNIDDALNTFRTGKIKYIEREDKYYILHINHIIFNIDIDIVVYIGRDVCDPDSRFRSINMRFVARDTRNKYRTSYHNQTNCICAIVYNCYLTSVLGIRGEFEGNYSEFISEICKNIIK